jgi:hypothetical protein
VTINVFYKTPTEESTRLKQEYLLDDLKDTLKKLILRNLSSRPESNPVVEEALVHINAFKLKARDHTRREHLVEKIVHYASRLDPWPIPPLSVFGPGGMGRTSTLGKALQKFAQLASDVSWWAQHHAAIVALQPQLRRDAGSVASIIHASTLSGSSSYNGIHNSSLLWRRKSSAPQLIRPVVVARIAGLTPDSSTHYLLMKSITKQIRAAFSKDCSNDIYNIDLFRETVALATVERPIIIVIAKLDRLDNTDPTSPRIQWLLDTIPPYIRIIISGREEKNPTPSSYCSIVRSKIDEVAPEVVLAMAKVSSLPANQSELQNASDDYILKTGELITPVIKASIKRWTDADSRKLGPEQETAIVKAYLGTSPSPVRILKLQYNATKIWPSLEVPGGFSFPRTIMSALDKRLAELEKRHGSFLTSTTLCLLACSRDGLTRSELEDLLSLDDTVLEEVFQVCFRIFGLMLR